MIALHSQHIYSALGLQVCTYILLEPFFVAWKSMIPRLLRSLELLESSNIDMSTFFFNFLGSYQD